MYTSSIFLGGLLYLVDVNFNNFYFNILVISLIAPLILLLYVKSTIKIQNTYSNYYTVSIYFKEEVVTCLAFLDTGNKLKVSIELDPVNDGITNFDELKEVIENDIPSNALKFINL